MRAGSVAPEVQNPTNDAGSTMGSSNAPEEYCLLLHRAVISRSWRRSARGSYPRTLRWYG